MISVNRFEKFIKKAYLDLKYNINQVELNKHNNTSIIIIPYIVTNYIIPSLINSHNNNFYKSLPLVRFIGVLLCLGIILEPYWTLILRKHSKAIWHLTLIYCFVFLTILNFISYSNFNLKFINLIISVIALGLLLDKYVFILLLTYLLAIIIALMYHYNTEVNTLNNGKLSYMYISILIGIIIIFVFVKNENKITKEMDALSNFAGAMAHEVRNMVGLSKSYASALSFHIQSAEIIDYKKDDNYLNTNDNEVDFFIIKIGKDNFMNILNVVNNLKYNSNHSIDMINRTLMIVHKSLNIANLEFELVDVNDMVKNAIETYGLNDIQINNICLKLDHNNSFIGSKEYFKHVLFSIIKNSYKYAGENCKINIWTRNKKLYIQDNGPGIQSNKLPYIFDKFYSVDGTGIGLGLCFCKKMMNLFGGDIKCKTNTEKGKSYTTIILKFP